MKTQAEILRAALLLQLVKACNTPIPEGVETHIDFSGPAGKFVLQATYAAAKAELQTMGVELEEAPNELS